MKLSIRIRKKLNYWLAPCIWKKHAAANAENLILQIEKPFYNDTPALKDETVKYSFIESNKKYEHIEFIKEIKDEMYVEPDTGFLIDKDDIIISESITIEHYGAYPDKIKFTRKKNITYLPEVVIFDHLKGDNYFHFYSEILGKLLLINEKASQLKHIPLVINQQQYSKKYFTFFKQFEEVATFNWYIQKPGEIIKTDKTYLLEPMPYDAKYWRWIKSLTKDYLKPFDPNKKIFINRPSQTGRHIENFKEIEKLMLGAGYEITTLEGKTIEQQIELFSSAAKIISIHGAGLTNIVFCDPRCSLLEIMPDGRISSQYYWLSLSLGLDYECILGSKLIINRLLFPKGKFYLDPEKLKTYLQILDALSYREKAV